MTSVDSGTDARLLIGKELKAKAKWVHNRLTLAKSLGSPLGEETITETVLLDLRDALGARLRVEQFSKYVESRRTGADWEWWFCDGVGSPMFGMRVQAKKLKMRSGVPGYDFAYKPKLSKTLQVDRLLAAAERDRIPAVYALYNGPELDLGLFDWNCCTEPASVHLFGVSLIAAHAARRLVDLKDTSLHAAGGLSRPWSCSALCPAPLRVGLASKFWPAGSADLSHWAADLVTDLVANDAEERGRSARQSALETARGYRTWDEAPSYVQEIVADATLNDEQRVDPERRTNRPSDLGGVVAFVSNRDDFEEYEEYEFEELDDPEDFDEL